MSDTNFYLLKRIGDTKYDYCAGFVIEATSHKEARTLAYNEYKEREWLNSDKTTCTILKLSGRVKVVLGDYRAG